MNNPPPQTTDVILLAVSQQDAATLEKARRTLYMLAELLNSNDIREQAETLSRVGPDPRSSWDYIQKYQVLNNKPADEKPA